MKNIYLDWAATSIPDQKILEKIYEASLETFANASSLHSAGIKAKNILENSRETCANVLKADTKNIYFTSGGTESNNISLYSVIRKKTKGTIISTNLEHSSVLEPLKQLEYMGFNIIKIDPDKNGIINPDKIEERLTENTILVSMIHVNNETGAIQPINKAAEIVKNYSKKIGKKILFHSDGVQAAGKIPIDFVNSNIDFYTISSHKISGPKGVGLLYCRENIDPLYRGGGQENGIRPGTENVAGIYGFSLALQQAVNNIEENLEAAEKKCSLLIEALGKIKECRVIPNSARHTSRAELCSVHGDTAQNARVFPRFIEASVPRRGTQRPVIAMRAQSGGVHGDTAQSAQQADTSDLFSPYILNFYINKIPAEVLVRVMSERGFFISAGSACSSHKKHGGSMSSQSQTLKSMKIDKNIALSSVRVSIGYQTKEEELIEFCNVLEEESKKLLNVV